MKKLLTLTVCLLLAVCLLTACSQKPSDSSANTSSQQTSTADPSSADTSAAQDDSPAESDSGADTPAVGGLDMAAVVAALEAKQPVAMAMEISSSKEGSDDYMTDLFGLNLDDIEDYYGKASLANVSSDVVMMVKAVPGKVDAVKAGLEAHRDNLAASFEMYLENQYLKASNGRVVVKGDYVLLVVLGDNDRIDNGEVETVYQELDEIIDQALA